MDVDTTDTETKARDGESAAALGRLRDDDRGAILVLVAFALVLLIAAMALTIDVGKQIRATAEAQNAADAAALAGAGWLALSSDTDGARDEAKLYASKNEILGDPVDIEDGDVEFFTTSGTDSIRVVVRREAGALDGQIAAIFGGFFGIDSLSVVRDAIAEVAPGAGGECLLPVGVMDRWWETSNVFKAGQADENDVFEPDVTDADGYRDNYVPPPTSPGGSDNFSGYRVPGPTGATNWGTKVVLWSAESPGTYNPSWWAPWVKPSNQPGAAAYRDRITGASCGTEDDLVVLGEEVETEPGKMKSQEQAWDDLMAQGPTVSWDAGCSPGGGDYPFGCVVNGANGVGSEVVLTHERIRPMPAYDAHEIFLDPGRNDASITNIVGVFVSHWEDKGTQDARVIGYLQPFVGVPGSGGTEDSPIKTIRLVE